MFPQAWTYNDHGPFPSVTITSKTKECSTNTSQKQSECDGLGDISLGNSVILGKLDSLNGEGVEIKGISSPGGKADEKENPVHGSKFPQKTERVAELGRVLPFCIGLASLLVCDDNTLFPDEEILDALFGCGNDTDCDWVGRHVERCHVCRRRRDGSEPEIAAIVVEKD